MSTEPSRTPDCKGPISHELGWYRTFPEFHEFRAPMCCQIVGALMSQHGEFMTSIEHCSCHLVIHAALPIPETEKVRDDGDLQSLTPVTEFVQAGLQPCLSLHERLSRCALDGDAVLLLLDYRRFPGFASLKNPTPRRSIATFAAADHYRKIQLACHRSNGCIECWDTRRESFSRDTSGEVFRSRRQRSLECGHHVAAIFGVRLNAGSSCCHRL